MLTGHQLATYDFRTLHLGGQRALTRFVTLYYPVIYNFVQRIEKQQIECKVRLDYKDPKLLTLPCVLQGAQTSN